MLTVFFDGACEPRNPGGTASYGFIIFDGDREIYRESKIVCSGDGASNNVAEYNGLINALRWLYANKLAERDICCKGDSKLVIEQMNGNWKMNKGIYLPWAQKCQQALKYFPKIKLEWVSRDFNIADEVSKQRLRDAGIQFKIQPESKP